MIRVFPRKTNASPADSMAFFDGPPLWYAGHDNVLVSCTFTYDKARAEFLAEQWGSSGYKVAVGGPAYDDIGGEFTPGKFVKDGYVITSRGCCNRCWFCSVWKREGNIREIEIKDGWNVLDSNLLQCSDRHIKAVFKMLQKQKEPVFTYLISNIGETLDINRFSIPENDLVEMVSLFNQFKGAKESFHTNSTRCKIQPIDKFDPDSYWSVDRWWAKEEKVALGIEDEEEILSLDEFKGKLMDTLRHIEEVNKELQLL